ncbi:hypothetical protein E4J93_04545 [Collinsella sp. BA40]|uniref:hypothetical protein n=2 Tax=unclassified Collinsella TaxID=2637548 RepID=UPI0011C8F020|nr:hypothetical protein [Collinsella sp. BA40]TXF36673.1 hypothetical protein E4J93_04545 [Collinsella sp. BA40]
MAFMRKLLVVCDKCGWHVEASGGSRDPAVSGWLAVDSEHHLCPACAAAYTRRKEEMERELKERVATSSHGTAFMPKAGVSSISDSTPRTISNFVRLPWLSPSSRRWGNIYKNVLAFRIDLA